MDIFEFIDILTIDTYNKYLITVKDGYKCKIIKLENPYIKKEFKITKVRLRTKVSAYEKIDLIVKEMKQTEKTFDKKMKRLTEDIL